MPTVEKTVDIDADVATAYGQWSRFEEFPDFMHNVLSVRRVEDDLLHWETQFGRAHRNWDARIIEDIPGERIAWTAVDGTPNAGSVRFAELGPGRCRVTVELVHSADTWTEKVADAAGVVDAVVEADLDRFKDRLERGELAAAPGESAGHGGHPDAADARRRDLVAAATDPSP